MSNELGPWGDYRWAIAEVFPTLVDALVLHHTGARLLVTAFDSGRFVPSAREVAAGWMLLGGVAVSPPLTGNVVVPSAGFDEWYIFDELPASAFAPEVFVNHIPFPLVWASLSESGHPRDEAQEHTDARERLRRQLAALQPATYVARAAYDVVVSRRAELIRDLRGKLESKPQRG